MPVAGAVLGGGHVDSEDLAVPVGVDADRDQCVDVDDPAFLRRRRAEQTLISVVATACLLDVSTRRVEKLAPSLGVTQLSKSQASAMAKHLDEQVTAFRNRPLDAGPYAFVWVDALTQKVRENQSLLRRLAIKADDIADLADEERARRELEGL
jgi:hypothetical protein